MSIQAYVWVAPFFIAILVSVEAGLFLLVRYRTGLARWAGYILLSQALELACYLMRWANLAPASELFFNLIQVLGYTLFCVFWLLFVFAFTRHLDWIRPRNLALITAIPIIYILMMVARLIQGPVANPSAEAIVGSLMSSPLVDGLPGIVFLVFGYGIDITTIIVMLRFFSKSNSNLRILLLPLLSGPILLGLVGGLELTGVNPCKPVSFHQIALASISLLAFFMVFDLRFRSVLSSAYETVVDQMQDGVLVLDLQDRIVNLNMAAKNILGPKGKKVIKHKLIQAWPEGAALLAGDPGSNPAAGEVTLRVNGQERTFDVNVSRLFDGYRESIGQVIVLRNVTGRERIQKELNERAEELMQTNAYLAALAELNVNLETSTDPYQIMSIVGEELKKLGLICFFAQLDPDSNELSIKYSSILPLATRRMEKLLGNKVIGFRLDKELFSPLYRILESNRTSFKKYASGDLAFGPGKISAAIMEQAIRLTGLGPEMAALVLPLVTRERTLGLLVIWGGSLREENIGPFRVFSSQVAHVMEKAILYEAEIQRSSELARSNNLVIALSKVASQLGMTSNSDVVLDTLGKELKKAGLQCAVASFDPSGETAYIQYLSFSAELIRKIEKMTGLKTENFPIPKQYWPGDKILSDRNPIWYPNPNQVFRRMFPTVPEAVAKQTFQLLGFGDADQLCFLPLVSGERTIGAMPIWGIDLKPSDNPILRVFASQVATAMKNAQLFDQAQQEIMERTKTEARIREALSEKELLLKEVHHRVKNNLQVISSLLNLQMAHAPDANSVLGLRDSQNRVRAMALIHEKLYRSNDLARVDFESYLQDLVNSLIQAYRQKSEKVTIKVQSAKISLNIDTAIPCGLIVNELVSNSLKYAFPKDRHGTITISCRRSHNDSFILVVSDDGVGLPARFDVTKTQSLGLKLVSSLVQQIEGELSMKSERGARYEIVFKEL